MQLLDLDHSICAQLDKLVEEGISTGRAFRRIDVSHAVLERFAKQLERMPAEQRLTTKSLAVPGELGIWRWRGIPVRAHDGLPDRAVAVILDSPETQTFRGSVVRRPDPAG